MSDHKHKLLEVNRTAWHMETADELGVLIDGEEYYKAARESMMAARRRIMLLAWEFHSQVELVRGEVSDELPTEMGLFLNALLEQNKELEIYILVWDYSLIYLQEREWRLFSDWLNYPHPRLHCVSDKTAPNGASHHQKLLTIDDQLTFCGGMDLSISRWDTHQHLARDERRTNPNGKSYDPYHDVQTVLTGDVAKTLAELARDRWQRATGERLEPLDLPRANDLWPEGIEKSFENVEVGVSVTFASLQENSSQMEQLHLDLIASARNLIFIENQYFSSNVLSEAIEEQLRKDDGPEVVMLLPRTMSGWLVESTMGLLRNRLLEKLHEADKHDRLRVYAPMVSDGDGCTRGVYVHAKVLVIDDRILKVGSSNLSNRSMWVDSECDLTLAFSSMDERVIRIRRKLLAMHQGITIEKWAKAEDDSEGLVAALDNHKKRESQFLEPMAYGCDSAIKRRLADTRLLDPDDPIDPDYWLRKTLDKKERPFVWRRVVSLFASLVVALLLGFAVVWGWGEWFGKEEAVDLLNRFKESTWTPLLVFSIFVLGGILGVPLNFMLVTTAVVVGSKAAILYGISGAIVSAVAGFFLGRLLGKPLVEKFGSVAVENLSRKLGERSWRSVAIIRFVPVAPFFLVNLFAGASHLKFKQYILGTILGMTPGMSAVVFLANRAEAMARRPEWDTILVFLLAFAILLGVVLYLKKILYSNDSGDNA